MNHKKHPVYCTYLDAPEHSYPGHPESPERIKSLKAWISDPPYPQIQWLDFGPADEGSVSLIHRGSLLTHLQVEASLGPHVFESSPSYITPNSYQAALMAVGATLRVSREIISKGEGRGFAIVRPPGHHAEPEMSMGFCLLNNIAIAAADAIANGLERVAIIDFDAHHGNGTEAAFWETPQVGYLSTHENQIYPGTGQVESAPHARGRIINLPLPAFSGNMVFSALMEEIITPWISQFKPEMIFVSAGYDGHFSDPLTTLTLNTRGYFQISQNLVQLAETFCGGRIMFVLEGGYDPRAIKDNIQAGLAAMSDHEDYPDYFGEGPQPGRDVRELIKTVKELHHLQEYG